MSLIEYDLPLHEICDWCKGHGYLWYDIITKEGIIAHRNYEKRECKLCNGTGNKYLENLELE